MIRGEWSESFLIEAVASIHPPLSSMDWETRNLSILDIAEDAPVRLLSKVNSFLESFQKLSRRQASDNPYLSVMRCQEEDSLLFICLRPGVPMHSKTSWWLKSPPKMTWSELKFAWLTFCHSWARLVEWKDT
jgi:hypothetical protein